RLRLIHRSEITRARIQALLTLCGIASVAAMFTVLAIAFAVYRAYAHDLKQPEEAIASASVGTSLAYDRTGQTKLYEFVDPLGGLKEPKPLTEISPWLIAATIATEDDSFYDNPGVNFRGLARAAVENLTPFGPGFLKGTGGSSITQQLVKNVYIEGGSRGTAPRTVDRKIKETVIALELKRKIEAAKADPLNYVQNYIDIKSPHFVFYVQDQVTKMCAAGLFKSPGDIPCDKVVTQGGLRITTTIDLGLQDIGQKIVEEEISKN